MDVKKRYFMGILILLCSAVFILGGCTIKSPSADGTTVRITKSFKENELFYLEEELCTVNEAKLFLMNQRNLYSSRYGEDIWNAIYEGEPLYTYLEENLREFLIRLKCMVLMAAANEVSLSDEDNTLITLASDTYYQSLSEEELAYCGAAQADVVEAFSDYYLANKLYRVLTSHADREISDDEARVITVQMIYLPFEGHMVSTENPETTEGEETEGSTESSAAGSQSSAGGQGSAKALADELHRRATQGEEDFMTLAETYSKGEWTEAQICRGETEEAFETAAFALSSGAISKVVTGEDGYYLIKCINNYEQELTAAHREALIEEWKQDIFKEAYDEFVSSLYLRFNDPAWDMIDFSAPTPEYSLGFYSCYDEFLAEEK